MPRLYVRTMSTYRQSGLLHGDHRHGHLRRVPRSLRHRTRRQPAGSDAGVTERVLPLAQATGIAGRREDEGDMVIELGSGEYAFSFQYSD
jgi:hypothetical protein